MACLVSTTNFAQNAQAMLGLHDWIRAHGTIHPALRFTPSGNVVLDDARVLGSSGDNDGEGPLVRKGDVLIALPPNMQISLDRTVADDRRALSDEQLAVLKRLDGGLPATMWAAQLGLHLLSLRAQEDSFFWPYIAALPQRFVLPLFFTPREIKELQYAPVIHEVRWFHGSFVARILSGCRYVRLVRPVRVSERRAWMGTTRTVPFRLSVP